MNPTRAGIGIFRWLGLFGLTLCNGALVFALQPAVAKAMLPQFGGSASVWTVVALFFQVCLLIGYVLTHVLSRRISLNAQAAVQGSLLLIGGLITWYSSVGAAGDTSSYPAVDLLLTLTLAVALPAVGLFANGPLIQWWAESAWGFGNRYRYLYAVSSVGNLCGLVAFPLLIEPSVGSELQLRFFAAFAFALGGVMVVVAALERRYDRPMPQVGDPVKASEFTKWVVRAAVPTGLVLALTSHITVDIAPVPLLWIVPLSLLLLANVIAFAVPARVRSVLSSVAAGTAPILLIVFLANLRVDAVVQITLHTTLVLLLLIGVLAKLAGSAPAPANLTQFFLATAIGGAAAGVFNAILAPVIFDQLVEYPLWIIAAHFCVVAPLVVFRLRDFVLPLIAASLVLVAKSNSVAEAMRSAAPANIQLLLPLLVIGIPMGVAAAMTRQRGRQSLAVALVTLTAVVSTEASGSEVWRKRTFYGVLRIEESTDGTRTLFHGTTMHGKQRPSDSPKGSTVITYYQPARELVEMAPDDAQIGVVGLGTGTIASFLRMRQSLTFYEIDPEVAKIALREFTYISSARERGIEVNTLIGDGRLRLNQTEQKSFDVIIVDAFSSDAVPVHLLTREALSMYGEKLRGDGVLALHLSNRHLDIEPVATWTALDAGFAPYIRRTDRRGDQYQSRWLILTKPTASPRFLAAPHYVGAGKIFPLAAPVWTDKYSAVWPLLR